MHNTSFARICMRNSSAHQHTRTVDRLDINKTIFTRSPHDWQYLLILYHLYTRILRGLLSIFRYLEFQLQCHRSEYVIVWLAFWSTWIKVVIIIKHKQLSSWNANAPPTPRCGDLPRSFEPLGGVENYIYLPQSRNINLRSCEVRNGVCIHKWFNVELRVNML